MEEAQNQAVNNPEEMKVVIESLFDTFVKYLNPEAVITCKSWDDEQEDVVIESQQSREASVLKMLEQIVDDETLVIPFTSALAEIPHQSDTYHPAICGGTDEEKKQMSWHMKHLVDMINGSLIRQLLIEDISAVLNCMLTNKIINQNVYRRLKDIENPHECCLELFKSIRRGKPNWPFIFFSAVSIQRPDLIQPQKTETDCTNKVSQESQTSSLKANEELNTKREDSQISASSDLKNELNKQPESSSQSEQRVHENEIILRADSKNADPSDLKNTSKNHPAFSLHSEPSDMLLNPCPERGYGQSILNEGFSELQNAAYELQIPQESGLLELQIANYELQKALDGYSEFSSSVAKSLRFLSEDDRELLEWKILINVNNVDEDRITSDPKFKNHDIERMADFSDEEDGTDEPDAVKTENIPDLSLRNYQKELAENALNGKNTIICAPTGCGKTRVATYIILKHLQHIDNINKSRKVAFLARTVPLVTQQCKSLKKFLPYNFEVTSITGDCEDSMHLHMILPDNDIIVMTPRILENHLKRRCLPNLGVFSMLIFDECHHTRKEEPYNTLMYSYLRTKKQILDAIEKGEEMDIRLPQIVGLTASIGVEKAVQDDEAVESILKVCGNLDAESISCVERFEEELRQIVPMPQEELMKLQEREDDESVLEIIRIIGKLEKKINHHVKELRNNELVALAKKIPISKKSQQYGQWAVNVKRVARMIPRKDNKETNHSVRSLIIIADYLLAYNTALEMNDLVLLKYVLEYLDKSFAFYSENKRRTTYEDEYLEYFTAFKEVMKGHEDIENPNLTRLKKVLHTHLIRKGDKSRGIIFVRTRAMTHALASWLNTCGDKQLTMLKATVFTGSGASVDKGGLTTVEQDDIVQRFRSGEIRLLVATSVGEEGIDVPECNLVIKYNHVGNEVATVQTRGRSRKKGGISILLAMEAVIRRERVNQEKTKMMERALKRISKIKPSRIRRKNKEHQQRIREEQEIFEIIKVQEESTLQKKNFQMVCHLCRKLVIDSKDIKKIFKMHRVVTNRDILRQTKTLPFRSPLFFDEIRFIGSVWCMGEPEEGKHCHNKIGIMVVYSQVPFVVLTLSQFGFHVEGAQNLQFYNKWKNVPYFIEDIDATDFKRYLPKNNEAAKESSESDDDDSDHGESNDVHRTVNTKSINESAIQPDRDIKKLHEGSAQKDCSMFSNEKAESESSKISSNKIVISSELKREVNILHAGQKDFTENQKTLSSEALVMCVVTQCVNQIEALESKEKLLAELNNRPSLESKFTTYHEIPNEPELSIQMSMSNDGDSGGLPCDTSNSDIVATEASGESTGSNEDNDTPKVMSIENHENEVRESDMASIYDDITRHENVNKDKTKSHVMPIETRETENVDNAMPHVLSTEGNGSSNEGNASKHGNAIEGNVSAHGSAIEGNALSVHGSAIEGNASAHGSTTEANASAHGSISEGNASAHGSATVVGNASSAHGRVSEDNASTHESATAICNASSAYGSVSEGNASTHESANVVGNASSAHGSVSEGNASTHGSVSEGNASTHGSVSEGNASAHGSVSEGNASAHGSATENNSSSACESTSEDITTPKAVLEEAHDVIVPYEQPSLENESRVRIQSLGGLQCL